MVLTCVQDITHARRRHDLCPVSSARRAHNYGTATRRRRPVPLGVGLADTNLTELLTSHFYL